MPPRTQFLILPKFSVTRFAFAAALVASAAFGQTPTPPAFPTSVLNSPHGDYQVLSHGVIHEAFVEPAGEATAPTVTQEQPPEPIQEQPPESKPEGHRVEWIPGYWAWDWITQPTDSLAGVKGFVWVSGLWRDVPPGRQWIAGHWSQTGDRSGYQWNAGYWIATTSEGVTLARQSNVVEPALAATSVDYLPAPPLSLDQGPNTPSPGADCFWIPGCWRRHAGEYRWCAGYWARQHPGWVWTPARYVHTCHGCVFVDGFWDYEPPQRGRLYGVVAFRRPVYRNRSYVFCPHHSHSVSSSRLMVNLFVNADGCFYYGDHHAQCHYDRGYRPWYESCDRWCRTTPLVSYFRWQSASRGTTLEIAFGGASRNRRPAVQHHDKHAHHGHAFDRGRADRFDAHGHHHDHRFYALGAGNRRSPDRQGVHRDHATQHDRGLQRSNAGRSGALAAESGHSRAATVAVRNAAKPHHDQHDHAEERDADNRTAAQRPSRIARARADNAARAEVAAREEKPAVIAKPAPATKLQATRRLASLRAAAEKAAAARAAAEKAAAKKAAATRAAAKVAASRAAAERTATARSAARNAPQMAKAAQPASRPVAQKPRVSAPQSRPATKFDATRALQGLRASRPAQVAPPRSSKAASNSAAAPSVRPSRASMMRSAKRKPEKDDDDG